MLHVLNEILDIFGLLAVSVQFVSQEFTILILIDCRSQFIRGLFTWNDKLELIGMTKNNPVQMFYWFFVSHLETIDKHFGLGFGHDVKLFAFLNDWAMLFVDTKSINLDVILLNLAGTDLCFTFFESVNQEPCNRWIFRNVDNVRSFSVLLLHTRTENRETCLFECFISALFEFFLFLSFFLELLFDLLFWFHHFSHFGDFIL